MAIGILGGLFILWVLFYYLHQKTGALVYQVLNRWVCWILFAVMVGQVSFIVEWAQRPVWVVSCTAFITWFIVETMFYWIGIQAFSKSDLPLFPVFRPINGQVSWPNQKGFIEVKEWIRKQGYYWVQSLKSDLHATVSLESSVYQNSDNSIRLQIIIMPGRLTGVRLHYVFSTQLEDGRFFVTDNFALPFGGSYPAEWLMKRVPLVTSPSKLESLHKKRLPAQTAFVPWGDDPAEDFKAEYQRLEQYNIKNHFLNTHDVREDKGKITAEGCYRLWKETWLMNYFGMAMRA